MSATVNERQVALSLDNRLFELILLPTEKCNFRCTYCYEDFALGKMKPETVAAIKKLLQHRTNGLLHLVLSWFGGEPLLAKKIILDLGRYAYDLSTQREFAFSGGLTTNGYLLDRDAVESLAAINHRSYQITLDGAEAQHNTTRRLANGRGTFSVIWRNLLSIRDGDTDCSIKLRLHVSRQNLDSVKALLEMVDREFGNSPRFGIHFHRISDLAGPVERFQDELSWSEYKQVLSGFSRTVQTAHTSEMELHDQGTICYAAKPNSLLVRSDGRIGKCTVALNDDRNHVGTLNDDGTIAFYDDRLRLWFEGYRDMNAKVLGCPLPHLAADPRAIDTSGRTISAALVA